MSDTDMDELSGRTGFEELRYRPQRASIQKPYAGGRAEPVLCGLCIEAARRGGGPAAARPLLAYTRLPARA